MMWIFFALGSAVFTSFTTIFTKIGIQNVKSNFATFFRTGIVLGCALFMCLISSSFQKLPEVTWQNYLFLGLSGIATGCSWLCYNRALKLGNVSQVAAIDKSSFVLTTLLFLLFFFPDTTKNGDPLTIVMLLLSMMFMLLGTLLMVPIQKEQKKEEKKWLFYAILSAVFASMVSLFIKIGLKGIPSPLGTLFRTLIVLLFSGAIVLCKKDYKQEQKISPKSWLFLTFSGLATGGAWLMEYEALNQINSNPVVVQAAGKLSILLTMLFSFVILKEKFTKRSIIGLCVLTIGIMFTIVFGL